MSEKNVNHSVLYLTAAQPISENVTKVNGKKKCQPHRTDSLLLVRVKWTCGVPMTNYTVILLYSLW